MARRTYDIRPALVAACLTAASGRADGREPQPGPAGAAPGPGGVIFDTDMDSDCDDAAALAVLHALADAGEAEILATVVSSRHAWSAPAVDAINTYHGRPDLPVGGPARAERLRDFGSKYARGVAEAFPRDLEPGAAPDAVAVYREALASQPDGSVTVVTVGDLTNLSDLLESPPDGLSPLPGRDLVAAKVRRAVVMGSRYPADRDPAVWGNFKTDPAAAVRVADDWPTPIVFTGGGDFANRLATGAGLAAAGAPGSPARRAYELYFGGAAKDRHSADQIAVLVAVRGSGPPWRLVTRGRNHVFPDGTHEWRADPNDPRHAYVSDLADGVDPEGVAAEIEELMTRPPGSRRPTPP